MSSGPVGLLAYRYATMALAPVVPFFLRQRALRGKEDTARLGERLGYATVRRPSGSLVWLHGASVGECMAVLPLVDAFLKDGRNVLVTSGTVTSARLLAERLPGRAIHQFVPIDTPAAVRRFLNHWQPQIGLFVDSELWPNLLRIAHAQGTKLALVNGRLSERSFKGWNRARRVAASLLSQFDICLAQDAETARRLTTLGASCVEITGSLKADAAPLNVNPDKRDALRSAVASRPILLAASTHPGEDETILPAHDTLLTLFPGLLTIVAPRHPDRGADIAMLCGGRPNIRRSHGGLPAQDTQVYIADTMGELGILYSLATFAFVGGSLIPHGGQNPLEPASMGCAVMAGPHTHNFSPAYAAIFSAQGQGLVKGCGDIVALAKQWLSDAASARRAGEAAKAAAIAMGGAVKKTLDAIEPLLADARA
jgi:3-deoxy-D-manno-octulosonic-acid transferase